MSERGSFVTEYFYCRECLNAVVEVLKGMDVEAVTVIAAGRGECVPIIVAGKANGMYAGEERVNFDLAREEFEAVICHPVTIAVIPDSENAEVFVYLPKAVREMASERREKTMELQPIHPIHDQVLVELDPAETVTWSGIAIPQVAQDKLPQKATVLAAGTGKVTRLGVVVPLTVKEGDRVLVDRWRGHTVDDGLKRLIVKEDEIVGVLEDYHADS